MIRQRLCYSDFNNGSEGVEKQVPTKSRQHQVQVEVHGGIGSGTFTVAFLQRRRRRLWRLALRGSNWNAIPLPPRLGEKPISLKPGRNVMVALDGVRRKGLREFRGGLSRMCCNSRLKLAAASNFEETETGTDRNTDTRGGWFNLRSPFGFHYIISCPSCKGKVPAATDTIRCDAHQHQHIGKGTRGGVFLVATRL